MSERDIIVGVTGASGAVYARSLVRELLSQAFTVHFIPTVHAAEVWREELNGEKRLAAGGKKPAAIAGAQLWVARLGLSTGDAARFVLHDNQDIKAAPASGTFRARAMVVVPCSMNTLAKIAHGIADTLLTRAAGVCLKEKRPLILVARETPFSLIDLRNQVAAAEAGAVILPAAPAFYHHPTEIADLVRFVVSKICDQLGVSCSKAVRYTPDGKATS